MLKSVNQRLVSSQFLYKRKFEYLSVISYTHIVRIVYEIHVSFAFTKCLARSLVEYRVRLSDSFSRFVCQALAIHNSIRMPGLGHIKIIYVLGLSRIL